jgi:predicted N-formylglutamate amidohydrolase
VHVGVHTFTPVFAGRRRAVDIGILFDPHRAFERAVAGRLLKRLRDAAPGLRIRRNLPYRGWTDGLTTSLRARFPAARYAGIELEVSQGLVVGPGAGRVCGSIAAAIEGLRTAGGPPSSYRSTQ